MSSTRQRVIVYIVFLSILFYCSVSYSAEDKEDQRSQAAAASHQQLPQDEQPSKPILPPVTPFIPSGVSPTPSPYISAPFITSSSMSMSPTPAESKFPKTTIHNLPSTPAKVTMPIINISTEPTQVPIIGNTLGKVISIRLEEGGIPSIEVRAELFDEILEIEIDLETTTVMRRTSVLKVEDIKIGDMVNVIFNQEGSRFTANFISILTEEDLKAIEENLMSGLRVAPEKR